MPEHTLYLILTAALALLLGAFIAWLMTRHAAQSQQFQLNQQLAERTQQYRFAAETLAQTENELAECRRETHALQADMQDLHARFAAACQQIEHLQEREAEAGRLKQDYLDLQQNAQNLQIRNERLYTQIEQERQAAEEKLALLTEARQSLGDQFHKLARNILEENSRRFSDHSREQMQQLLHPLNERLHGFSELVRETYDKETRERLTLENELKRLQSLNSQLHHDAKALTDALTGSRNKTQGNWGEMILESILAHSGLTEGREYTVQAAGTRREEDGSLRRLQPDVLIQLPDHKQIIIDAKVSLTAYVRYTQAPTPEEAAHHLAAHVASIRTHLRGLAAKNYHDISGLNSLDFVFMFIPVEPAYLAALQHDDTLWQECFDKRIMLAGPGTLLAMLRTVANLWRNEQQNQNALIIAEEGGRLYDKFVGFVQTLESVGKNIEQAQMQYQAAYKQLTEGRGNLVGRAEKLRLLGVKAAKQLDKRLAEQAGSSGHAAEVLAEHAEMEHSEH